MPKNSSPEERIALIEPAELFDLQNRISSITEGFEIIEAKDAYASTAVLVNYKSKPAKTQIVKYIVTFIARLQSQLNNHVKLDESQMVQAAKVIYSNFKYDLKIEDFEILLMEILSGKYGKIEYKLDVLNLCGFIQAYIEKKIETYEIEREKEKQYHRDNAVQGFSLIFGENKQTILQSIAKAATYPSETNNQANKKRFIDAQKLLLRHKTVNELKELLVEIQSAEDILMNQLLQEMIEEKTQLETA